MAMQVYTNQINQALFVGDAYVKDGQTILQDAGRATALAYGTVMALDTSTGKWSPLTAVSVLAYPAQMLTGANGTNLAGWQAVTDGAFKITVDGTEVSLTGLDFSSITTLEEITDTINYAADGKFTVVYDSKADKFKFFSPTTGAGSTITVLTAGASGTDISGSGFLNGLTGTGTVTAGSGTNSAYLPAGILISSDIAAADLVAGDVTYQSVLTGGVVRFDKNLITLENSLTLADVITVGGLDVTIEQYLAQLGLYAQDSVDIDEYENA